MHAHMLKGARTATYLLARPEADILANLETRVTRLNTHAPMLCRLCAEAQL